MPARSTQSKQILRRQPAGYQSMAHFIRRKSSGSAGKWIMVYRTEFSDTQLAGKVAGDRQAYASSHGLDLTYITDNVIAMSFPAAGWARAPRVKAAGHALKLLLFGEDIGLRNVKLLLRRPVPQPSREGARLPAVQARRLLQSVQPVRGAHIRSCPLRRPRRLHPVRGPPGAPGSLTLLQAPAPVRLPPAPRLAEQLGSRPACSSPGCLRAGAAAGVAAQVLRVRLRVPGGRRAERRRGALQGGQGPHRRVYLCAPRPHGVLRSQQIMGPNTCILVRASLQNWDSSQPAGSA